MGRTAYAFFIFFVSKGTVEVLESEGEPETVLALLLVVHLSVVTELG